MIKVVRLLTMLLLVSIPIAAFAQPSYICSFSAAGSGQLPVYVAKDLGFFDKYNLNVDLVLIIGAVPGMQALLGGSTHFATMAAMAPINTILAGGDVVIAGGSLNKNLLTLATRKEIQKPSDLRGKKIGVTNFGGSSEYSVLLALKEWKIPREAVTIVPGYNVPPLVGLESGHWDAVGTVSGTAAVAEARGFRILAELSEIVPEIPDRSIVINRSFLKKERGAVKRFIQGISEGIYLLKAKREREKVVGSLLRRFKINRQEAETNYDIYQNAFSFPPRVGRRGMQSVLDLMQQQTRKPKADFELSRFVDESVTDELEKEGFFKKLEMEYARK